jgi:hypothetical protein
MERRHLRNIAFVAGISLSVLLGMEQSAVAARFAIDIAYTESQLLPPWDIPETGTGFFEFDGTTYGELVTTSLVFQNYETFPGTPLFPGGQTEPYPLNTESLLTPIVFTPGIALSSTPTRFSAIGSLNFQTSVGLERCLTDPIARGASLCGAFVPFPLIRLDLIFDQPIFDRATSQFFASNFSWSLTTTTPLQLPGLSFSIPEGSIVAGGVNVETANPFPGNIGPSVIPANRATPMTVASVPEPVSVMGLLATFGMSLWLKRRQG